MTHNHFALTLKFFCIYRGWIALWDCYVLFAMKSTVFFVHLRDVLKVEYLQINTDELNFNKNTEIWGSTANPHSYLQHVTIVYLSSPAILPLCPSPFSPFLPTSSFPHITPLFCHELQLHKAALCGFCFINDWHLRVLRPQLTYKTCCVTTAGS